MLNLLRSHGIYEQHKCIVSWGQLKFKVMLKSSGLLDLFLLMIVVDGTQFGDVIGAKKLFLDIGLVRITGVINFRPTSGHYEAQHLSV